MQLERGSSRGSVGGMSSEEQTRTQGAAPPPMYHTLSAADPGAEDPESDPRSEDPGTEDPRADGPDTEGGVQPPPRYSHVQSDDQPPSYQQLFKQT